MNLKDLIDFSVECTDVESRELLDIVGDILKLRSYRLQRDYRNIIRNKENFKINDYFTSRHYINILKVLSIAGHRTAINDNIGVLTGIILYNNIINKVRGFRAIRNAVILVGHLCIKNKLDHNTTYSNIIYYLGQNWHRYFKSTVLNERINHGLRHVENIELNDNEIVTIYNEEYFHKFLLNVKDTGVGPDQYLKIISLITAMSLVARREGLLALENYRDFFPGRHFGLNLDIITNTYRKYGNRINFYNTDIVLSIIEDYNKVRNYYEQLLSGGRDISIEDALYLKGFELVNEGVHPKTIFIVLSSMPGLQSIPCFCSLIEYDEKNVPEFLTKEYAEEFVRLTRGIQMDLLNDELLL